MNSEHNINVQRLLLLSKGYTESNLQRPNEPRLFLSTLHTTINEIERHSLSTDKPPIFTAKLQADFENGSFPVHFQFGYEYNLDHQILTLKHLEATLFDTTKHYRLSKQSTLPTTAMVLKELKTQLRQDMRRKLEKRASHAKKNRRI